MTNKFISFLDHVGHDFKVGFDKVKPFTPLLALIPGVGPVAVMVVGAVITIEQKFTAMGQPTGTGPQKLAEVTAIVGPVLEQFLASEGKSADAATVTKYINDIVAVLNDQPAPAPLPA